MFALMLGQRHVAILGGASREPAGGGSGGKLDGGRGVCTTDGRVEDGSTGGGAKDKGVGTDDISCAST